MSLQEQCLAIRIKSLRRANSPPNFIIKMAVSSGLLTSFAVHPKLLCKLQGTLSIRPTFGSRHKTISFQQNLERRGKMHHSFRGGGGSGYVQSVGSNHLDFTYDNGVTKESYWSTKLKEFLRGLQFLLAFLAEQPGQLKYIEWPSFQSTLKTATLTLVIVVLLIVALSSVDGGLSYLLGLYLRRNSVT
ncbi:putative preprotein translocase subunit SecE [Heracleum sosnowskyi]|uniref:Preprotein translocase subunit SecE n=1 Tax=Heracleum sosnowskyi TaxID=360622 RepID=A0AAD8IPF2_9APIA|nr:putative preprotein translocase subunit SecE [Heracleum sosnowskyi]